MTPGKNRPARAKPALRLVLTRVLQAPCPMVFQAWTEPGQMVQWWSPENIECRSVTADGIAGGAYRIHMVSPEGDHVAFGKYTQFERNKRLQFTWQWEEHAMPETLVTVEFEARGKTTRLTLTHEGFVRKADVRDHTEGWTTAIEKFARLIEQRKIKTR